MKIYSNQGIELLDIQVDDTSVRYRSIMQDDSLTLKFSHTTTVTVPVGSYVEFEGQRYTLWLPENFKKHNTRNFEYTITLGGWREALKLFKFKDLSAMPYRLKFSLTASPKDFLQLIVDNMNVGDSGWTAGSYVDAPEKTISFKHEYVFDVINRIAQEFTTEWEIENKTIHLRKVEKFKDDPLALSYGKGNGFKSGVGRANDGDNQPIGRLYVQGGERNIDFSTYGSTSLLLPKSATLVYDGKTFRSDAHGMYIARDGNNLLAEGSFDANHIYPKRVGTVSAVVVVDAEKHFYDINDASIPELLDYSECRIEGEKATISFQSGALAGREFDIEQTDKALTGYVHAERLFKIVPQELDGVVMPGGAFVPAVGDKYAIFNISMPESYIEDNATKTGASWEMFEECVKYFAENEKQKFNFTGELDGIWAKSKWLEIGGKIVPGGHVDFSDEQFLPDGEIIRITAVKDYVNFPYKPEITLSNAPIPGGLGSQLGGLEGGEVVVEDNYKRGQLYTKRRWRDLMETMGLLESAILDFDPSISPITIRTMQLIAGDEALQYRFVNNKTTPIRVPHSVTFDKETKILTADSGIIQHMTLGINTLSPSHKADEYLFWNMAHYASPPLEAKKPYYLYAKCDKTGSTGSFVLSEIPIELNAFTYFYHFLVSIVGSEQDGERSIVELYGFTEILPGRITTDKIISADGKTYFDLAGGEIGGKIKFLNENNELEDIEKVKLFIQYSVNGSSWHDVYNVNDKYMRQKNGANGTWSGAMAIRGADGYTPVKGTDYFDGKDGQDGESKYLWIRYSQNSNGNPFVTDPTNAKYIGIATTLTNSPPSNYLSYDWSLIKGTDGIAGEDGENGQTSYLHIKYSNDGTTFTANNGETVGAYIGTYVDFVEADSMTFSKYTWNKVKGNDGYTPVKGTDYFDGEPGLNGKSEYLHIRYSAYASGYDMSEYPSASTKYIGILVNNIPGGSTVYTHYRWAAYVGKDGIPGEPGPDGQTSYLHIKYSDDGGATFTGDNGEDPGEWIGVYVDFIEKDSDDPIDYTWNLVRGDSVVMKFKRSADRPPTPVQGDLDPVGWLSAPDEPSNNDIYWLAQIEAFVSKKDEFNNNNWVNADKWIQQANGEWKSNTITHGGATKIRVEFHTRVNNAVVTINTRVSSEQNYDKLYVGKVDSYLSIGGGNSESYISGTRVMAYNFEVAEKGRHFIEFSYEKDSSPSVGSDAGFVSIAIPEQNVWMTFMSIVGGVPSAWNRPTIFINNRIEETIAAANMSKAITDKFGTTIDGGLVNTVMMLLREANSLQNTAGISGIQGVLKNNPAFWAGGEYAQAIALIGFLSKMSAGMAPADGEYAGLAKITMLHNGAAKIGDFIIEESGRIVLVNPETGKARLVFSAQDILLLEDLLATSTFGSTASGRAYGSITSTTAVTLATVYNVKSGSTITFKMPNIMLNASSTYNSNPGVGTTFKIELLRNGTYYNTVKTIFIPASIPSMIESAEIDYRLTGVPSGSYYSIRASVVESAHTTSASASVSTSTLAWTFVQSGVRNFMFGLNGFFSFFSDRHIYFSEQKGFDVKGPANMPGVLLSTTVAVAGAFSNSWGAKRHSTQMAVKVSTGTYDVYHSIGHTNYTVNANAYGNRVISIVSKGTDRCRVAIHSGSSLVDSQFDITLSGNNYA